MNLPSTHIDGTGKTIWVLLKDGRTKSFNNTIAEVREGHLIINTIKTDTHPPDTNTATVFAAGFWLSATLNYEDA